ncbi:syntaxin-1A-like [Corticium candelabrum]|uniref:syntaxin-1A-like n=1 Tax=Corticium candelabrum TaxID=121492 RepID=UPI002E26D2D4|nr:syntaxin-1A-like [Corticium candelabrum]
MVRDRLEALRQEGRVPYDGLSEVAVPIDGQPFLSDLFDQVDYIRDSINEIQVTVDEIKQAQSAIIGSPQPNEADRERLEAKMSQVKRDANMVRGKLKTMEKALEEEQRGPARHSADFRIRKAQHSTLSRKFLEIMEEYNRIQVEYREKCIERIERQLIITNQNKTHDEVEAMVEENNLGVFTQGILVENAQMKQALGDITARHNDIIRLENSIRELHDMFLDMAMLVEEQGDMVDRIEYNVEKAAAYVESAKKETRKALTYQRSARRKKVFCAILVVVILVVIGAIIAGAVTS